jgi:hypothetical protein
LRGWLNYFHHARCKGLLKNLDSWIRRKPRCYRLKQCKRVITLQRFLERPGVDGRQSRYWLYRVKDTGASQVAHKHIRLSTTAGLMQRVYTTSH